MTRKKKLLAATAAIAVATGLGIAGTAYASTGSAKAPTVSESTQHGPDHAKVVDHGPGHERGDRNHGVDH